jgi:hypothetical protein
MQTLDLNEASVFLKMNPEVLRRKAHLGEIPGKKTGKRWVFVREHLADWISGRYPVAGQNLRVIDGIKQEATWQSTNEKTSGGFGLPHQMDDEYKNLLGLK